MQKPMILAAIAAAILTAGPGRAEAGTHWRAMADEDLAFIHDVLQAQHPGAIDAENPGFAQWLDGGFARSRELLPRVAGLNGYEQVLRHYVNGFADEHVYLDVRVMSRWQAWPGIAMAWDGQRFVVHQADADTPARDAVLESCDGRDAETLWRENVQPFFGREGMPADRYVHAPRVLLAGPLSERPASCRFSFNGETRDVALQWRLVSPETRDKAIASAAPGSREALGIRAFGDNGAWITLPTFGVQGDGAEAMKRVMAELRGFRDADFIVVDVRGNSGGSSWWGRLFVEELYGQDYARFVESERAAKLGPITVDYRVTAENVAHFEGMDAMVKDQLGEDSDTYAKYLAFVLGMRETLARGEDLYTVHDTTPASAPAATPAFAGKLVFLTDAICVSACLDFADYVHGLPRVTHAGQPTSADTAYMEVRDVALPSGNGSLSFATKVYRGGGPDRGRGPGGFYAPERLYVGDITDTRAVERWVVEGVLGR